MCERMCELDFLGGLALGLLNKSVIHTGCPVSNETGSALLTWMTDGNLD